LVKEIEHLKNEIEIKKYHLAEQDEKILEDLQKMREYDGEGPQ
jgi:hypothetical protein